MSVALKVATHAAPATERLTHAPDTSEPFGIPEWFIIAQTALPALLILPGTQSIRVVIRILPFALSLGALCLSEPAQRLHPAARWLIACMLYLFLMIFHPATNTVLAGFAQCMLYLAVLAPVFWASSMVKSSARLKRLLMVLLVCNGINSAVGVLQVYDPQRWLPAEFSSLTVNHQYGLEYLTYIGPDGRRIVRPPGLFDTPGAVCGPAMIAALLGVVFFLSPVGPVSKLAGLSFAGLGLAAIFLTQVRTSLVILLGSAAVYGCVLLLQKKWIHAAAFIGIGAAVFLISWSQAVKLGGDAVETRYTSLAQEGVATTYKTSHRAPMLFYAFDELLPRYPFGAGLARWGMMRVYFGDESNTFSSKIWSELQIDSWILDGGVVLLGLYSMALLVTAAGQLRIAYGSRSEDLRIWSAPVIALCAGTGALVFGFTPFTTQVGLQYWFLAGSLYGVWLHEEHGKEAILNDQR